MYIFIYSNPLVGSCITYSSMRTILHRIRNSCFPPIPNSMEELKDSLLKYEPVKEIYKGYVISTNNEIAIIFSTDILLVALAASTEIYVDGTFSVSIVLAHIYTYILYIYISNYIDILLIMYYYLLFIGCPTISTCCTNVYYTYSIHGNSKLNIESIIERNISNYLSFITDLCDDNIYIF